VQINELSVTSYFHALGPPCDSVESRYHNGFFRSDYSTVIRANKKELIRQHPERQNNVLGVKCFDRILMTNDITPNYCYEFDTVKIFLSWNKLLIVAET
jgi:hypothetical protein